MASEWHRTTIGELIGAKGGEIKTGPFGTTLKASEYSADGTGVPLISVREIGDGRIQLHSQTPRVPSEVLERLPEYLLQQDDLVFGRKGAVDRLALVSEKEQGWFLGSDGIRVRFSNLVCSRFIAYQLRMPMLRKWLVKHATGTTMASLNQRIIGRIPVVLPPLVEQRRIADILGAFDDKIALNRVMNRTLEQIAQTLFQAWFVDFEGETDLVDSDLGPIPRGWNAEPLAEVADFLNGTACQKYPPDEQKPSDHLPVIKIRELRQGFTDSSDYVSRSHLPEKYVIESGDVLFSWSGSLVLKVWTDRAGALNQHIFKVSSDRFARWFYYQWVRHHLDYFRHIAQSKATTMGHIRRHHLNEALVAVPPQDELLSYGEVLSPMMDRAILAEEENSTLAALRDTLLPKLISGEIRVPEAEEAVEAVS